MKPDTTSRYRIELLSAQPDQDGGTVGEDLTEEQVSAFLRKSADPSDYIILPAGEDDLGESLGGNEWIWELDKLEAEDRETPQVLKP